MFDLSPSGAARVAYAAAALNSAAALATLFLLRPGLPTPGTNPSLRLEFIARNLVRWRLGWLLWHAAAIAAVVLFLGLARRFSSLAPGRTLLAAIASLTGLAADLTAQTVLTGAAPYASASGFLLAESIFESLGGYLANGLYTLAGILLTWAGWRQFSGSIRFLSPIVWGAGLCLSLSSLAHWPAGELWSTAVVMPAFVIWAALVGRWFASLES